MVFALLHGVHMHASQSTTQKLDGNNSECGMDANSCSGSNHLVGPVARPEGSRGFFKSFLTSPQHQAREAAKTAAAAAHPHINRYGEAADFTGISTKAQIASASSVAAHPLVAQPLAAHSNSYYSTAKPIPEAGVGGPKIFADQTGYTLANRQSVAMGILPTQTGIDSSPFIYIDGSADGYKALSARNVTTGNKATYLLAKGMPTTGKNMAFVMSTNSSRERSSEVDTSGFGCPGVYCAYAPPPNTQWQNPTYGSV